MEYCKSVEYFRNIICHFLTTEDFFKVVAKVVGYEKLNWFSKRTNSPPINLACQF